MHLCRAVLFLYPFALAYTIKIYFVDENITLFIQQTIGRNFSTLRKTEADIWDVYKDRGILEILSTTHAHNSI